MAFRCHGLATSGRGNVVRKQDSASKDMAVQARTSQLKPKIGIILGTTRPTRFSEKAAQWLANIAKQRDDAEFEVVDLRDYPMPFFEEERADVSAAEQHNRVALGQVGRSNAGKSGVVGKCPQARASTGNASDRRSSLIARYPRRFAH